MWPMGFVSLSSSMRKAEEARRSADKKKHSEPTRVSRTNIKLSPSAKIVDRKPKPDRPNVVKKRLGFYEGSEPDESKNKINLKSFAQFAVSKPEKEKSVDHLGLASRSMSLPSDEEATVTPQRAVPLFRSTSQFEKYFSEGEGSVFSGRAESDKDFSMSQTMSPPPTDQTISDLEHSLANKSLPTSPRIKKVQFIPTSTPASSENIRCRSIGDKSPLKNAADSSKRLPSSLQEDDSEEDMSQKEWYKQVFRVVHKLDNLYSSYPIPQVDDTENMIPPRPRIKKESGKKGLVGGGINRNEHARSYSLPSTCRTECRPVQTNFKNSKRVVLTGENSDGGKAENSRSCSNDRLISKRHQNLDPGSNLISENDWQQFLRPSKASVRLFEDKNHDLKHATALFDFFAHYSNELSFKRGDHLTLLRKVDEHWYEAEMDGKRGLVPFNYLEVMKFPAIDSRSTAGDGTSGLVLRDFQANYPSEISARKNDVVSIIRHLRGDWLEVRIGSQSGLIPAHHVSSYLNYA